MPSIDVKKLDDSIFEVTVQGRTPTTHMVTVTPDYAAKLASGRISIEHLVKCSFEFLLEREPNTSILRRFDLPLIAHYFPEYERVIGEMMQREIQK